MMSPELSRQASSLLAQLELFLNSVNMLMCAICTAKLTDGKMCPNCSYIYCAECFRKTLRTCNRKCPHCSYRLGGDDDIDFGESKLIRMYWFDPLMNILDGARSLLQQLVQAPSEPPHDSELDGQLVNLLTDRMTALLCNDDQTLPSESDLGTSETTTVAETQPLTNDQEASGDTITVDQAVREIKSISRLLPPRVAEERWSVWALQWSRAISNLFYAGFAIGGADHGLLGLFTADPVDHPGCLIETEGQVISLDVHPTQPDTVCVGTCIGFEGVALYRLRSDRLSTVDLSTVDGLKLFHQQFLSSPSDFRFHLVWKTPLPNDCPSVFWFNPSQLIAITYKELLRLKLEELSKEPKKEYLAETDAEDLFLCMDLQHNPVLTTSRTATESMLVDRQSTGLIAVGTEKGSIKIFSILPSFRLHLSIANAHTWDIQALTWNPVVPEVLASGGIDDCIKLWRMETSEPLLSITLNSSVYDYCLQWAPYSATMLAVRLFNDDICLFDLAVDRSKPVAVSPRVDGWRRRLALNAFQPLILAGSMCGKGIECLQLNPNPMIEPGAGSAQLTGGPALDAAARKLRQLLQM